MWISFVLFFTAFIFATAIPDGTGLSHMADVVYAVKLHFHSGCVSVLLPSTADISRPIIELLKLLSARGVATATLKIQTVNFTLGDAQCRHNRPLYVLTQRETLELKQLIATTSPSGPTWLLFSNSSILLEHLFRDIYIPFNCEFLVAREDPKGCVTLFEVYRVNRTSPLQNSVLAVGSQQPGLTWDNRSLYERRNDLQGATIKVTFFQNPPAVESIFSENKLEIGGMFGKAWYTVGELLNYSTELHPLEDTSMGATSKNGTWSGAIRMLVYQVVDVAVVDVTMTSRRVIDVDFSVPLLISRICLFIRTPESSYEALHNILAPFSSDLWFAVQGAMVVLAACLSFAYYVGRRYDSPEKPDLYTLPQALLCVFEIFCQQGHEETPRSLSCRLIYWVSYVAAVVLFAAYSGALISSLALQRIDPPFTTLRGLLQHGGYSVATAAQSAHFNNFDQATDETMKGIYEKLFDKNMPVEIVEGLRNVCWRRNYAFMTTHSTALALAAKVNCSIIALKEAALPESLAMAFSKRSPYSQIINLKLIQLRNTGILTRLHNNAWPMKLEEDKSQWTSVSIDAVTPVFFILTAGIILATLLMFLERQTPELLKRSWRRYRTNCRPDSEGFRDVSP